MRASALVAAAFASLLACTAASSPHPRSSPPTLLPSPTSTRVPAAAPADWPVYHYNSYRTGDYPGMPRLGSFRVAKSLRLDGAVYASALAIHGYTIVATENNTVYLFNARYGLVWKRHLGAPSPASQRPCGNIDPLGITGTPAYSAATGRIYVAAELSGNPPSHRLYAINFRTGAVTWSHTLDFAGVDRRVMQQRGALALVGSRVYVPFGGLAGDCGNYKGRIVGWATNGRGQPVTFTVPTAREAGIWTPPGPVADYAGRILVAVGNGASGPGDRYDHSDSVLELSTSLKLTDSFSPRTWAQDNAVDADLGSQAPTIMANWVFSAGKSGTAYVLRRTRFGGIGGEVSSLSLCRSFGGTAQHGSLIYVPCTDGIRAVRIDSAGKLHVVWHTAGNITGSPVVGGGRVWSLDPGAGRLYSLDAATGQVKASIAVGQTSRFATPAIYGRDLLIPTLTGVTVVRTS